MATARAKGKGYEIRVYIGLESTGKKITTSTIWTPDPGMTKKQIEKELERQKILFEEKVKTGTSIKSSMKFRDFADMWMREYASVKLAPKTYARYGDYLKRINKGIGHIKLKDLKPVHLNALYRNLEEDGVNLKAKHDESGKLVGNGKLAPKTVLEHHHVVSKILSTAVKWQILDNNAASFAEPPKTLRKETCYLDEGL